MLKQIKMRGLFKLPRGVNLQDLQDLSFYSFWRQYDVKKESISKRRTEQILALNGVGWSAQAALTHKLHDVCTAYFIRLFALLWTRRHRLLAQSL